MSFMQRLWVRLLTFLGGLENHTKPQLSEPEPNDLPDFPQGNNRSEILAYYGSPPKRRFPNHKRAKMVIVEDLPGGWNNGKPRLYMHSKVEAPLREALEQTFTAGCLNYIERMGCYVHRHMRHDKDMPLSYHSWGIAFDINSSDNRSRRKGVPMPFSQQWHDAYPFGVPRELVIAFKDAGFSWGGDWGNSQWEGLPRGYDMHDEAFATELAQWQADVSYCDPMHFEGTNR